MNTSPLDREARNTFLAWACSVVTLLCVFLPTAFWNGGVLEGETITFIVKYADDRTLLQKVFDPRTNDFDMYQARELSYFFDYLDVSFHLLLVRLFNVVLFIPLSAVASSVLIILVYRRGLRQTLPGVDRVTAELSLLPFLTCFVFVSTMGLFYRSAKPLLAPVLLALLFHILRTHQSRARGSTSEKRWAVVSRQSLVTFGLLLFAALLDRQGFFYVLIACSVLLVHYLVTRKLKDLLIASVAAAIFAHVYNVVLGPAIIWAVNGYQPDFLFQHIPMKELAALPVCCLKAGRLLIANVATVAGGYYIVGYLVLSVITTWSVWRAIGFYKGRPPGKFRERYASGESLGILYALMVLALQIGMFGLMIARHPYVYDWADHWYWYYPLPFLVTMLFGLALLLNAALPHLGAVQRRVLRVVLVLIAVSNLLHLPAYKERMLSSNWFGQVYAQSEMLKAAIQNRSPDPRLPEDHAYLFLFYEERRNR